MVKQLLRFIGKSFLGLLLLVVSFILLFVFDGTRSKYACDVVTNAGSSGRGQLEIHERGWFGSLWLRDGFDGDAEFRSIKTPYMWASFKRTIQAGSRLPVLDATRDGDRFKFYKATLELEANYGDFEFEGTCQLTCQSSNVVGCAR